MIITVLDTETTGLGEADEPCEVALVTLDSESRTVLGWFHSLVKPTVPVAPEARAAHHIAPEALAAAPPLADVLAAAREQRFWGRADEWVAAHNAEFDLRLLRQAGVTTAARTICTWRCALHLWPEAPAHSNQVLRYWLGLDAQEADVLSDDAVTAAAQAIRAAVATDVPRSWDGCSPGLRDLLVAQARAALAAAGAGRLPPHRALPDALVTAALLARMLETRAPAQLEALTLAPVLLRTVRFGKHRGRTWEDVARAEPDYLRWVLRQRVEGAFDPDVRHTAGYWLGMLR